MRSGIRRIRSGSSPVRTAAVPSVSPAAALRRDHRGRRAKHLRDPLPYSVVQFIQPDERVLIERIASTTSGRISEAVENVYTPAPLIIGRTPSSFRKSRMITDALTRPEGTAASAAPLPIRRRRVNWRFMDVKHTTDGAVIRNSNADRGGSNPDARVELVQPGADALEDFRVEAPESTAWSKGIRRWLDFSQMRKRNASIPFPSSPAAATPSGPRQESAYEHLVGHLLREIAAAGPFDGVYLALHGAMVAEHIPQADDEIVRRVRNQIGPVAPLVVSHDFHANILPRRSPTPPALLTYQQNPHLDTKQRGARAASILARTIRGRSGRPRQSLSRR